MALSIEAYRGVANSGMSQLALLSNERHQTVIGSASETKVGFLKRLFNTEASRNINLAVTRDFKAALVSTYSAKVAEEAFSAVIGKDGLKGAKLSSALVARTLSMADKIVASRLACPETPKMMLTMRLDGAETSFNLSEMADPDRKTMGNAKKTLAALHDLLMDMPTDTLALQDFTRKITAAKADAESLLANDLPKVKDSGKVVAALRKAVSMVEGKIAEATEVCGNNPVTYKSLTEFAKKYIEGARQAMMHLPDSGSSYCLTAEGKGQMINTIRNITFDAAKFTEHMLRAVTSGKPRGASMDDACPDPKSFIGKDFAQTIARNCAELVVEGLRKSSTTGDVGFETATFAKDMEKSIKNEVGDILNNAGWDPIEKTVTFALDGVSLKGKSVITPASHMGGAMTEMYRGGPKGYNCMSFGEARHAVNLAHSEFKVEIDGQQQTVFSGIRHGVHAAVDIESKSEFKAANLSRARETLIAAFTSSPALLRKALANPSQPCEFVFNSVSLLTPDFARNLVGSRRENEKLMLKGQTEAYQGLNGQTIEFDVPGENGQPVKVKIRPVITTFNYGVNWGGVGGLSSIFGGWGESKDMNAQGLRSLNNLAAGTLDDLDSKILHCSDQAEKRRMQNTARAIRTLMEQVNGIDQRKTYSSDGHEAYKMASRIAVLTNLLGGVPAWNCKSGKDRTGMMDVECKFLATLVALGKDIPRPGAPLTAEQKLLYRNLLLQSGNHEMQKYNTGVAGYKLEGVGSITERIGDIASQRMFLGASTLVHS